MRTFTDFFGLFSKGKAVFHIVEASSDLPAEFGAISDPGGTSFPEGALLDPRTIAQGLGSEAVLQLAEYELAQSWFGWRVRPTPEAQILMGRGVGLFGLVIAAEARGPDQRFRMITSLLNRYDEARAAAQAGLALDPNFTLHRFRLGERSDNPTYLAQRERIYEGMRMAGVPEG